MAFIPTETYCRDTQTNVESISKEKIYCILTPTDKGSILTENGTVILKGMSAITFSFGIYHESCLPITEKLIGRDRQFPVILC